MEDATTMPAAVVMTSLDEEREDERYSPMPHSNNDMPLLQNEDPSGDLALQSLRPEERDVTRRSFETGGSHETSSLMRVDSNIPEQDPRGEAPAYFEVVDLNTDTQQGHHASVPPTSTAQTQAPQANAPAALQSQANPGTNTTRRSGFRTLLNRMSMHGTPQHQRGDSTVSAMSSTAPTSASRASQYGHQSRPSQSSLLSVSPSISMFRTLSRQRSTHTLNSPSRGNLTSPSLISLNSISPPLTHTLTRTEITYPRSGPTPEQMKMISSREGLGRFGVPYGEDAVRYAASAEALGSRLDLVNGPPPPDFEEAARAESSPRISSSSPSAGPSRLRSSSNAADLQAQPSTPVESSTTGSTSSRRPRTAPSSSSVPSSLANSTSTLEVAASGSVSSKIGNDTVQPQEPSSSDLTPQRNTQTSTTPHIAPTISEFGKLSAPPSAFIDPAAYASGTGRSESAASMYSHYTYATAAESLTGRSEGFLESEDEDEQRPGTTKPVGGHAIEATDSTVMPATH